jgi:hypothetical protein
MISVSSFKQMLVFYSRLGKSAVYRPRENSKLHFIASPDNAFHFRQAVKSGKPVN